MSTTRSADELRGAVRDRYADIAEGSGGCCGGGGCCGPGTGMADAGSLGYAAADADSAPEGADLGLGCGNPHAIASLRPGETVVDLGSGAGFDCFLAARAVGPGGHVIGVDMTPEMIGRARDNAARSGLDNVSFRLGEIENLPLADAVADAVISNCVINLSPDKARALTEAYRVLRPGGRVAIADIVTSAPLPQEVQGDLALYTDCVAGAASIDELRDLLRAAGFTDVVIRPKDNSRALVREWLPGHDLDDCVVSATIEATKPAILTHDG